MSDIDDSDSYVSDVDDAVDSDDEFAEQPNFGALLGGKPKVYVREPSGDGDGDGDEDIDDSSVDSSASALPDSDEDIADDSDVDVDTEENEDDDDSDEDVAVDVDNITNSAAAAAKIATKKPDTKKVKVGNVADIIMDDADDEDDEEEDYLQKFDKSLRQDYVGEYHQECLQKNYDEIQALCKVVRNDAGIIIDSLHKTLPFLTKYERARVIGQRTKQIEDGAKPFIKVPEGVIDGEIIAKLELDAGVLAAIIWRPVGLGGEYWKIGDLIDIQY